MDDQVEEIKQKLEIVDVINRFVPLKKRGRHHIACCPFHSEKTPSFVVSPELQIFKCFGCGKAGDAFTFLQEYEHITFREALEELAKLAGITLKSTPGLTREESHRHLLLDINRHVTNFYHHLLTAHPLGHQALEYVLGRGLTLDTLRLFRLGFSPSNPQYIIRFLTKKGFSLPDLIATGTFGRSQYHSGQLYDRFQGRLIFPLYDYRDRILGFSGRIIPGVSKPDLAKYINSPETGLYHKSQTLYGLNLTKEAIKKNTGVIVTEGEFDLISPYQAGITNIVAIKGTAFTQAQLQLLRRFAGTLILALDSDFAGNHAAIRSIELADSLDFDIKVLDLMGKYKDPDEAIRQDPVFFKNQCQSPLPIWDFVINSSIKTFGLEDIHGKKQVLSQVLPFLSKISNSVIRSDYFRKLANLINSDLEAVVEEASKYQPKNPLKVTLTPTASASSPTTTSLEKNEEYLLTLLLSAKKPSLPAKKIKHRYTFFTPRFGQIFTKLVDFPHFQPQTFAGSLPAEIIPIFQNLYLNASTLDLPPHRRHHEMNKTLNHLLTFQLKSRLHELGQKIARFEALGQDEELKVLETEYNQLLGQLSGLQADKT